MTAEQLAETSIRVKQSWDGTTGALAGSALGAGLLGGIDYYKNKDSRRAALMALLGGGLGAGAGGFVGHAAAVGNGDVGQGVSDMWGNVTGLNPKGRFGGGDIAAEAFDPTRKGIHPNLARDVGGAAVAMPAAYGAGRYLEARGAKPAATAAAKALGRFGRVGKVGLPILAGVGLVNSTYNALTGQDSK